MKVKKIAINAFGKITDKVIHLEDGINIIYGPNEAGKSSVHQFMEAMFYGQYKPYTKNRQYESVHELYNPWSGGGYGGALVLEDGGHRVRIERQLTKGNESLAVYDDRNGMDISGRYDYNNVIRQVEPGLYHFGFNKSTYRNTVSITQMGSLTDDVMIDQIRNALAHMSSSDQPYIAIDKVLDRIEAIEKNIGSLRKTTSDYYKSHEKIKALSDERKESQIIHDAIGKEKINEQALKEKQERLSDEIVKCKDLLEKIKEQKNRALFGKINDIKGKMASARSIMTDNERYKAFTVDVADVIKNTEQKIAAINAAINEKEILFDTYQKQLEGMTSTINEGVDESKTSQYDDLNKAVYEFDEQLADLRALETNQQNVRRQKDLLAVALPPLRLYIGIVPAVVVSVLGGIVALTVNSIGLFGVAASVVGGLIFSVVQNQKRIAYEDYMRQRNALESEILAMDSHIDDKNKNLKATLSKYHVDNYYELQKVRDEMRASGAYNPELEKEKRKQDVLLEELVSDREQLMEEISSLKDEQKGIQHDLIATLKLWSFDAIEDVSKGLKGHMAYEKAEAEYQELSASLDTMSVGRDLKEISLAGAKGEAFVDLSQEGSIAQRLEELEGEMNDVSVAISNSVTKQTTLGQRIRGLAEIDECIEKHKRQLEDYEESLAVTGLMKSTIEGIVADKQKALTPTVNKGISSVVKAMSDGRYDEIQVDDQLNLMVWDESNKRTVTAKSLSAGTLDMLYFGLRIGMAELLANGKRLPLILDDAFVQYDDVRVANVLNMLLESQRQILIFTCHRREIEWMSRSGIPFNNIEL